MDNNYKLYKCIFGNIYLSKTIFNYIKGTGIKYDDINIKFIVNNGEQVNIELLKDKLKIGISFQDFITTEIFKKFMMKLQKHKLYSTVECDQLLTRFYEIYIDSIPFSIYMGKEPTCDYEISKILIDAKCLVLLKLYLKDGNNFKYRENRFYEASLSSGDIRIIKYIHSIFNLDINEIENFLLWSIVSSNRDEIFDWLFNDMCYTITDKSIRSYLDDKRDLRYYYENLKKLRYDQIKRILESGKSYHYYNANDYSFHEITNYIKSIPITSPSTIHNDYLPFNKVLDFIQSSIYISTYIDHIYTQNQISNYNDCLIKIQLLIKYNDSNCQNNEIKKEIINIQNGNGNWLKKIGSIFLKQSSITNVKFDQFNLEREIRRIYIFQYLCDNKELITMEDLSKFIIQFISSFKEYHLFENLKQIVQFYDSQRFILQIFIIAFDNADSTLIHLMYNDEYFQSGIKCYNTFPYTFNYNKIAFNNYSIPLFNCNLIDISKQIEFLNTFTIIKPLIEPLAFEYILEHIFNGNNNENNNNLSIDNLNSITLVIESFYNVFRNQYPYFVLDYFQCLKNNIIAQNYFVNICKKSHILFKK